MNKPLEFDPAIKCVEQNIANSGPNSMGILEILVKLQTGWHQAPHPSPIRREFRMRPADLSYLLDIIL